MFRKIDESRFLSNLLEKLSNFIAKYRGVPIVVGIVFVVISLVVQSINVYQGSQFLSLVGVITHNLGVLIALIGILVSVPIGK